MSSRTNTMIPPLFWSRSKRNGEEYPGILNWLSGKESSSFVSEMTITSTFPEIWSVRISNLFLKEFMLRWDKTIRLGFFVRITFRLLSETTSDKRSGISSLDSHSWTFTSKQFESISSQKVDLKYLRKLLVNKELPFLFKCSFFISKCSSMMLLFWVKSIFFWLQYFLILNWCPEQFYLCFLCNF